MPDVTLTMNHALPEKFNAPWNVMKTANGMAFAYPRYEPGLEENVFFDSALPDYFWREPNTGIIIIKPAFWAVKKLDLCLLYPFVVPAASVNYGSTSEGGGIFSFTASTNKNASSLGTSYQNVSPKLQNNTDVRIGLVVDGRLEAFIEHPDYSDQNMVWNMQTQVQLQANQAWSVIITPSGIPTDFTNTYVMVAFGQKLILEITMAGIAYMWGDVDGLGTYVKIDTYVLKDGGVNLNQSFQVAVIPLGRRFLSVSFTQSSAPGVHSRSASYASKPESFLTVLQGQYAQAQNNLEPNFDTSLNQWVKYPAAPLTLGLVANDFDYTFQICVGWFPSEEVLYMSTEYPPEDSTAWNGVNLVTPYKLDIEGQYEAAGGAPTSISTTIYDIYAHTPPVPGVGVNSGLVFYPSQTGIYSPELHGYGISYPANVQTPAWTPVDLSADWQLIRFMRTTDLNPQRVELKLLRDQDYLTLYKLYGPSRLSALDNSGVSQVLSDFYPARQQPVSVGSVQLITDQFTGTDIWDRLDSSPLLIETVLEGSLIAEQIKQAIMDAGFLASQVFIDYAASPELAALTFGLFQNPNDILRPNSDSSCGDFIRNVASKLGVQFSPPLRVRWVSNGTGGMWWRIYIGPIYQVETSFAHGAVQNRFFLDDSLMSTTTYGTQAARYRGGDFSVQSAPEWTSLRPDFNALLASAAKGVDGKQGADVCFIPPPTRVMSDSTYYGFEGAMRVKQLGTEDLQIAQTDTTTAQIARQYYEQHYNLKRLLHQECAGEWQPEIDVDQFVALIGRAKEANPAKGYAIGDPVCYGAFRIEHVDIEIRHDFDDPDSGDELVRYEWAGSYTMTYVGPYEDTGFTIEGVVTPLKMWTVAANLPDDYDLPSNW